MGTGNKSYISPKQGIEELYFGRLLLTHVYLCVCKYCVYVTMVIYLSLQ